MAMLKDHKFWVGFAVGIVAYLVYTHYMARKATGG